jgi:hypothetical protein
MKFRSKYFVAAVGVGTAVIVGGNAIALPIAQSQITELLQKQVVPNLPKELAGLIDSSGNIQVQSTLETLSKKGAEEFLKQQQKKGDGTKTAGQEADAITKNTTEVAQAANNKAHQDSLDDFKANAPIVDKTIATNSTPSESSLEAADKANNINGAVVASAQRQINSTNNLTTAVQISNTNAIRQAQLDRVNQTRERVDIAANRADIAHTRAALLNRYYPDAAGNLTKVTDNSGVTAFEGK